MKNSSNENSIDNFIPDDSENEKIKPRTLANQYKTNGGITSISMLNYSNITVCSQIINEHIIPSLPQELPYTPKQICYNKHKLNVLRKTKMELEYQLSMLQKELNKANQTHKNLEQSITKLEREIEKDNNYILIQLKEQTRLKGLISNNNK